MKTCTGCGQSKSLAAFSKRGKGLQSRCKACQSTYHAEWYAALPEEGKAVIKSKAREATLARVAYVRDLKTGPCTDCGNRFHPVAMDFDHIGTDKLFNIGSALQRCSLAKLKVELKKCELVCSNCHRVRTFMRHHGGVAEWFQGSNLQN